MRLPCYSQLSFLFFHFLFLLFIVIGCPCVHTSTEASISSCWSLFLNNICVLVGLMGQTSVDVNQIEITMTMQSIFLVNLHL